MYDLCSVNKYSYFSSYEIIFFCIIKQTGDESYQLLFTFLAFVCALLDIPVRLVCWYDVRGRCDDVIQNRRFFFWLIWHDEEAFLCGYHEVSSEKWSASGALHIGLAKSSLRLFHVTLELISLSQSNRALHFSILAEFNVTAE